MHHKYEIPTIVMLLGSFSSAIKKWRALQGRVRCLYTARPGEARRGRIAAALGLAPTAPGATRPVLGSKAQAMCPDKCVNQCCMLLLRWFILYVHKVSMYNCTWPCEILDDFTPFYFLCFISFVLLIFFKKVLTNAAPILGTVLGRKRRKRGGHLILAIS